MYSSVVKCSDNNFSDPKMLYFLVSHLLLQYSSIEGIGNSMGIESLVKSEAFII